MQPWHDVIVCLFLYSFSKGKRSNLRRSSVQLTLNSISELVTPHVPDDISESLVEEPVRRTRRKKTTAVAESEPIKRSTRNKGTSKAKEPEEIETPAENSPEKKEADEAQCSGSSKDQMLVSEAIVKIPSSERLSAEKTLESLMSSGPSPSRSANKIPIAASEAQLKPQGSSRASVRRSLVARRSLVGLRQSMTQEAVRRASRRSFLKKKARQGNSTCSSSISGET